MRKEGEEVTVISLGHNPVSGIPPKFADIGAFGGRYGSAQGGSLRKITVVVRGGIPHNLLTRYYAHARRGI